MQCGRTMPRWLCLAALASAIGCAKGPSATNAAAPSAPVPLGTTALSPAIGGGPQAVAPEEVEALLTPSAHELLVHAMVCAIGSMPTGGRGGITSDLEAPACKTAAAAASVPVATLRDGDALAIQELRIALERRIIREEFDDVTRLHILATFDKTLAAAREAWKARDLADATEKQVASADKAHRTPLRLDAREGDLLRSREKLHALLEFAQLSDAGTLAAEAEAAAWILGTDRFLLADELPDPLRPLTAEPLLAGLMDVAPPNDAAGSPSRVPQRAWGDYLRLAAGSVPMLQGTAIGGGRIMPETKLSAAEKQRRDLAQVTSSVAARMDTISAKLPQSGLRDELDAHSARLRTARGGGGGDLTVPLQAPTFARVPSPLPSTEVTMPRALPPVIPTASSPGPDSRPGTPGSLPGAGSPQGPTIFP